MLLTAALGVALVGVPGTPNVKLDASWQMMLIHAREAGLQFGRDMIFTWGPWGFLCNGYHLGRTAAVPIIAWQTAGQFLVAFCLVALTRELALWRRLAFAVLLIAFHWIFMDVEYFVLITLTVLAGLLQKDPSPARIVAWVLLLGFLSEIKFTYFALASAGVLSAAAYWAARRSWSRAAAVAGGYALAVLAAWCAAGQDLDNLYPYLRRSLELASGYADAMGLDEARGLFLWGAAVAILCAVFLWRTWRSIPDRAYAHCACSYLAFSLFAMWKEGFTRADLVPLGGHVFGWFVYVLVLAPAIPGVLFPGNRLHWFDCAPLVCLTAFASFDPAIYRWDLIVVWQQVCGNARTLGRLGSLPQEWQSSYEKAAAGAQLPRVQRAVGGGSVDVYDFETGVALMNGLSLDSRPIFQGYGAYTPKLEGWNLRHYQAGGGPDFLLWSGDRVNNRYPGQDDALLVAALPGHYEPLFEEGGFWLFRRTSPVPPGKQEHQLLAGRAVLLSEEFVLPSGHGEAIWLQADAVPTLAGRLRSLLYKPAEILISVTDDRGSVTLWRIVPRVARAGFLLVPTLATGADAAALMEGQTHSWVRSFHFESPPGQERYWSRVEVEVFSVPSIPLHLVPADPGASPPL
ncbi:MAG TPA: hypothetical protein VII43_08220 [Opitutaceae bacterium]